jgi:nucleotide-binding universal stress UspA family protein
VIDSLGTRAHLLVGVDFSDGARAALAEARRLADRMQVVLHVIHVSDPVQGSETALGPIAEQWLAEANVSRDQLHVRSGQPWAELARLAGSTGAVAVVIGSHGRSGYQPVALGSTATRLGVLASCPVIVVNRRTHATRASADHSTSLQQGTDLHA